MIKSGLDVNGHTSNLQADNGLSGDTEMPEQPTPAIQSTRSKASNHSIENSESLLSDHVIGLDYLTESQQLNMVNMAIPESDRTSKASLPQKESFATESQTNKTDSFFQEIDRFKKSFKRTFEGYNDDCRESGNMKEIFRFISRHPSQQFGVESFSSKPNSLANKLENEKRSIKSKDCSTSSMSVNSMREANSKSLSTEKGGRDRLFMIKKVFGRPGLKKKQAMILHMGLNGMSETRNKYTDNITSNGENDYVQSLDTSYDNNVKELQENFKMSNRKNKIVSCDVDRGKYLKSDPKTQETYSFLPTENYSILRTQNIVEVLEHIEKQRVHYNLQGHFKHREFPTENGFISLIDRLENKNKDNKKQQRPYNNNDNSLLRKVNLSAYDLEIDYTDKEVHSHQNSGYQDRSASQVSGLGIKEHFVSKHNLSLDEYLDSQRIAEEDRQATEGSHTSRRFDVEVDIQELNKVFLNSKSIEGASKDGRKAQVRWQSQARSRKFYDSRAVNQSCTLPQPDSPDSFAHKGRKYTPVIRPRERKLASGGLGHNKSEIISIQDGEEFDSYSLQDRANMLKNQRKLSPYNVFSSKPEDRKYLVRPRKVNVVRQVQLQKCYGEPLKLNQQEKIKKKV